MGLELRGGFAVVKSQLPQKLSPRLNLAGKADSVKFVVAVPTATGEGARRSVQAARVIAAAVVDAVEDARVDIPALTGAANRGGSHKAVVRTD